jgi:hypothetical protein
MARRNGSGAWLGITFCVSVALVAHLMFSGIGFNPTDDGFTLAYSRRILEGQVPHRDFIIVRPVLSPMIHLPLLLFGGDYLFWLSRLFVWFQLACIAWIWTSVVSTRVKPSFDTLEKLLVALIAFAASAHTFPIMAWHTIDGLFLLSIGLAMCVRSSSTCKFFGYMLMGAAYLTKQSFLLVAPLCLIILGDQQNLKFWLAATTPGMVYLVYLALMGALPDAILQLSSHTSIISAGLKSYLNREALLGIAVGYSALRMVVGEPPTRLARGKILQQWVGMLALSALPLLGISTSFARNLLVLRSSFGLFGIVVGASVYFLIEDTADPIARLRVLLLALVAAWSASLSIGYNYPILASGQLLTALIAHVYPTALQLAGRATLKLSLAVATVMLLVSFTFARFNYVYRDQPLHRQTGILDQVLPGAKRIRTNPNTLVFLTDLAYATSIATQSGKTFAIIPDCAGYWVQSTQINPLSIDWPQGIELRKRQLLDRVLVDLELVRQSGVIIVQKVEAYKLAWGFVDIEDHNAVVNHVRQHFEKTDETRFFELYE